MVRPGGFDHRGATRFAASFSSRADALIIGRIFVGCPFVCGLVLHGLPFDVGAVSVGSLRRVGNVSAAPSCGVGNVSVEPSRGVGSVSKLCLIPVVGWFHGDFPDRHNGP